MAEYIVSARKYRPQSFRDVIGQQGLTTTLMNSIRSGKLAHAYLFCGPRGVGKTTCARIFAKAINCLQPTTTGEACCECESCRSFDEARSYNIFELDAASNNSVENIKSLMEQTRIPPQVGRYKVFIIDEVHMLSQAAFNAFLKTLEEPPAHVIFVLATTEKNKILPTILSRCQIYDFDRMGVDDIIHHLKNVAEKEGISTDEHALAVIAEKADGGMRDALSIFDQAASFCQGNITYQNIITALNIPDTENFFNLTDYCFDNKVTDAMVLLGSLISSGHDGGQIIAGLAKHVRNVLMAKDVKTLPLLEVSERAKERYTAQAQRLSTKFLYQALKIMNDCDVNYRASGNKRLTVELTLIRMAQVTQEDDEPAAGRPAKRLKSIFSRQTTSRRSATKASSTQSQTAREEKTKAEAPKIKASKGSIAFSWNTLRGKVGDAPAAQARLFSEEESNAATTAQAATFTTEELSRCWVEMCNRMPADMVGFADRLKNAVPTITTFPAIEVVVGNSLLAEQVEPFKQRIVSTLRRDLKNQKLTLTIRVAAPEEKERVLTRSEIFEQMRQENDAIETLRELFDLELA